MSRSSVLVGVATYKRPDLLTELLNSLVGQECAQPFDVLVVDNDPDCSAQEAVSEFQASALLSVTYCSEPEPGIAAARNRVLDGSAGYDVLLFIDDDETAHPSWVNQCVQGLAVTGAVIVHGEVVYDFPAGTPRWITGGGFFINPDLPESTVMPFAATNNLGIDLTALRALGDFRFDDRLGLAGGSDLLFTGAVVAAGGEIRWWPSASVRERVPSERTTTRWVLTRAVRSGESQANSALLRLSGTDLERQRRKLVGYGVVRLLAGVAIAFMGAVSCRAATMGRGIRMACRGTGVVRAVNGRRILEYQRNVTG